jgi:hypothetical protein
MISLTRYLGFPGKGALEGHQAVLHSRFASLFLYFLDTTM